MYQASAMKLRQEVSEKNAQLDEADERLAEGLPPTPEAAKAWSQFLEAERRAAIAEWESGLEETRGEVEDWDEKDGPPTRAKPRINAYIPHHTTGQLPIPKPFHHPRFEPSVSGSSMRHVVKQASASQRAPASER